MSLDNAAILQRFQGMVRLATVSSSDVSEVDFALLEEFHRYLEETFPLVHQHLRREVVGRASLLYHWQGDGSSDALPIALMAHMDVVPPGDVSQWSHPPFGAEIAEGYIWGRGTLDTKSMISAQLEAVEELLREGYRPPYDLYLCYGHNEEVVAKGTASGAKSIVSLLKRRGVRLGMVVDEGGCITDGSTLGIDQRVGLIGLAEKGIANVELSVTDMGGHSSQPRSDTAVSTLARAVTALADRPMRPRLLDTVADTLDAVAPHMGGAAQRLIGNKNALWPVLSRVLAKKPATNAMIRTTIAPTMATGSARPNVLPEKATVTVNCRILPGDTLQDVLRHIRKVVGPGIGIKVLTPGKPSPESRTGAPYALLKELAEEAFPDAVVTSYLMLGGSDSRYYYEICDHVYRFAPFYFDSQSLPTAHAVDERLPADGFAAAAEFFMELIRRWPTAR